MPTRSQSDDLTRLDFCSILTTDEVEDMPVNNINMDVPHTSCDDKVESMLVEPVFKPPIRADVPRRKRSSRKTSRPCTFCGGSFQDLRRHLLTTHKNHPEVKPILDDERSGIISKSDRIKAFNDIKKEGIRKYNQRQLADNHDDLIGERLCDGQKVMCSGCSGFFKKDYYYRHRKNCISSSHAVVTNRTAALSSPDDKEWLTVLSGMRQDEMSDVITADPLIQVIGHDIWKAKKVNKEREGKQKARRAMRRVARLKKAVGVSSARELFVIENIKGLESSMHQLCLEEGELKAGLQIALGTLVKQCSSILIDYFATSGQKAVADEIREFREVFAAPIHYAKIMAVAEYQLKEKRQRLTRKPSNLPDEAELGKLLTFIEKHVLTTTTVTSQSAFVQLRKVVLARITLLNARRGSEAARLLVTDWVQRHEWIQGAKLTEKHRALLRRYSVAFVMGKGDSLLPVFFPANCTAALNMLADSTVREKCGVSHTNKFLFAYSENSQDGPIGYNEIRDLCVQIGIRVITATAMRHRASTAFWGMDISEEDVECFMEHVGHHRTIDKNIYACPPAMRVMQTVTPILEKIDGMTRQTQMQDCPPKPECYKFVLYDDDDEKEEEEEENDESDNERNSREWQLPGDQSRKIRHPKQSGRSYTHWSESATAEIHRGFHEYISSKNNIYPGKKDILKFQSKSQNEQIRDMAWGSIKTKIVNECVKAKAMLQKLERKL